MRWIVILVLLSLSLTALAETAQHVSKQDEKMAAEDFKRALEFQKRGKLEDALLAATHASQLVPANPEYLLTREMLRQQIVSTYLDQGNRLAAEGKLEQAAVQFREALARDPQNSYAQQRLHDVAEPLDPDRTRVLQLLAGVSNIDLQPTPGKKNIHAGPDVRTVYTQIGQAFGVFISFDPSMSNRQFRLDVDNIDFYTAMSFLGRVTKTFWAPVSSKEAIVANDTQEMRTAYERMAMRTFYVGNTTTPNELSDVTNLMRVIFDAKFVSIQTGQNTITVRAPRTQIEAIASFIDSIMDAKPEILLVLNEFEFDADKLRNWGLNLPTDFTVFNIPSEIRRVLGNDAQSVIDQINQNGTIDPSKIPASDLANLQGSPLLQPFVFFGKGLGLTGIVVPPISGQLSETRTFTANLEHVNLRALDGEAATFRAGTRFPIVTSSLNTIAFNRRGQVASATTPQFQYIDLGLTLKTTPHYHVDGAIRLDLELEVQGLGAQSFNGIPELTTRSFKGNITVREGEPSVVAGLINDQELRSTRGYPGISQLPGLRTVLNTNSSDRAHNEILLVVTPYVIRKPFHDRGPSALWNLNIH